MKKCISLFLALVLCLGLSISAQATGATFTDVPANHWAYSYVERAAENGWVNGVGNGQFGPEKQISYAEMFTMMVRVYLPEEADGYQDYPSLIWHWYDPYALVAFDYSFTDGLQFDYDVLRNEADKRVVTRYDLAQFLYNITDYFARAGERYRDGHGTAAEWGNFYFPKYDAASVQAGIADWSSVPANYREAVTAVVGAGIITGVDGKGTFNGDGVMTRAQAATVICRFIDVLTENGAPAVSTEPTSPSKPGNSSGPSETVTTYALKNGKPITEENVIEMLKEIEKQYPHGTPWSSSKDSLHNPNPVSETLRNNIPVSTTYACGGFAAMVSDLIFPEECEVRVVTDFSKVRPGDIVFDAYRDEESGLFSLVTHVWIALGPCVHGDMVAGPEEAEWMIVGRADGNMGGKISWSWPIFDEGVQKYNAWTPVYPEGTAPIVPDKYGGYQAPFQYILTRYPD